MDVQSFISEFGHIANAPGGVERLRELILLLAISGRLINYAGAAVPIEQPLGNVAIPPEQRDPSLGAAPFEIPHDWRWLKLEEACSYVQRGKSPRYAADGVLKVVSQKCVQWSGLELESARYVADDSLSGYGAERFLRQGDLLCNSTGTGTVGRVAIVDHVSGTSVVADSHVTVIRAANASPSYLRCVFASPWVQARMQANHLDSLVSGSTQQVELATGTIRSLVVPIPPRQEQDRIVAKVEELMVLCSSLEKLQVARREAKAELRKAVLSSLTSTKRLTREQGTFALKGLSEIAISCAEDVSEVLAALGNMAVRGLLVEAGSAVSSRAKEDCDQLRDHYVSLGLIRRSKPVSAAKANVDYPKHWRIVAFDDVAIVTGGVTKGRDMRGKRTISRPYLSVANVQRGHFKLGEIKSIEIAEEELEKYLVRPGDLLITEGGDWDKVGRAAVWKGEVDECLHQNHIFKARIASGEILGKWVELVFNSDAGQTYFSGSAKRTTNLASINMSVVRSFPFPIPPLEEQERILRLFARFDELCSTWRAQLEQRGKLASNLASASVASLSGVSVKKDEGISVKVPKTQIFAPLHIGVLPEVRDAAPLATLLARSKGQMLAGDLWHRFGGDIDEFYAQLKAEVASGWIADPSYVLNSEAPDGCLKYPDGERVARVLIRREGTE